MQKKYRGGQAAAILYNIKGAITVFLAISAASGLGELICRALGVG